jgi:hypothetical protein
MALVFYMLNILNGHETHRYTVEFKSAVEMLHVYLQFIHR